MSNIATNEPFWVLLSIHVLILLEIVYFRAFKSKHLIRIQNEINKENNRNSQVYNASINSYSKFPKNSFNTFIKSLKVYII